MGRYGDLDYPTLTRTSFLLGLGLFAVGGLGELVGHAYFAPLPGWEQTLLFDLEALGLVVAFFSPIVFGILLPLTE
jgi:hypothetical protein